MNAVLILISKIMAQNVHKSYLIKPHLVRSTKIPQHIVANITILLTRIFNILPSPTVQKIIKAITTT